MLKEQSENCVGKKEKQDEKRKTNWSSERSSRFPLRLKKDLKKIERLMGGIFSRSWKYIWYSSQFSWRSSGCTTNRFSQFQIISTAKKEGEKETNRGKVALEDHVTDTPEETDVLEVGETELGKAPLLERWATKDTSDRNRSDDSARVFESVLKHNR